MALFLSPKHNSSLNQPIVTGPQNLKSRQLRVSSCRNLSLASPKEKAVMPCVEKKPQCDTKTPARDTAEQEQNLKQKMEQIKSKIKIRIIEELRQQIDPRTHKTPRPTVNSRASEGILKSPIAGDSPKIRWESSGRVATQPGCASPKQATGLRFYRTNCNSQAQSRRKIQTFSCVPAEPRAKQGKFYPSFSNILSSPCSPGAILNLKGFIVQRSSLKQHQKSNDAIGGMKLASNGKQHFNYKYKAPSDPQRRTKPPNRPTFRMQSSDLIRPWQSSLLCDTFQGEYFS